MVSSVTRSSGLNTPTGAPIRRLIRVLGARFRFLGYKHPIALSGRVEELRQNAVSRRQVRITY